MDTRAVLKNLRYLKIGNYCLMVGITIVVFTAYSTTRSYIVISSETLYSAQLQDFYLTYILYPSIIIISIGIVLVVIGCYLVFKKYSNMANVLNVRFLKQDLVQSKITEYLKEQDFKEINRGFPEWKKNYSLSINLIFRFDYTEEKDDIVCTWRSCLRPTLLFRDQCVPIVDGYNSTRWGPVSYMKRDVTAFKQFILTKCYGRFDEAEDLSVEIVQP
jgi:hypothetical protein